MFFIAKLHRCLDHFFIYFLDLAIWPNIFSTYPSCLRTAARMVAPINGRLSNIIYQQRIGLVYIKAMVFSTSINFIISGILSVISPSITPCQSTVNLTKGWKLCCIALTYPYTKNRSSPEWSTPLNLPAYALRACCWINPGLRR